MHCWTLIWLKRSKNDTTSFCAFFAYRKKKGCLFKMKSLYIFVRFQVLTSVTMNRTIFRKKCSNANFCLYLSLLQTQGLLLWPVTVPGLPHAVRPACHLLLVDCLPDLPFDHEDGGITLVEIYRLSEVVLSAKLRWISTGLYGITSPKIVFCLFSLSIYIYCEMLQVLRTPTSHVSGYPRQVINMHAA
jgi:hypothetical protein